MITGIFNLLKSLASLILSVGKLILDTIVSIIQLIIMIPTYISYVAYLVNLMPTWITSICLGIVAISVIWVIRKAI